MQIENIYNIKTTPRATQRSLAMRFTLHKKKKKKREKKNNMFLFDDVDCCVLFVPRVRKINK